MLIDCDRCNGGVHMSKYIHILIVEDDEDINRLLCQITKQAGYIPQPAYSGTEALLYFEKQMFDLILLDLMLPGKSGKELLQTIRRKSDRPIIIVSAKEEQMLKVSLLYDGADDYITKPFDAGEVVARIAVQLRRFKRTSDNSVLAFKDIVLDLEMKEVKVSGKQLSLTAREYHLLKLFLSYQHKMFTKENIFESVWGEGYYGDDNTVNVHMSHLRAKLAEANPHETYIETLWGLGYRLKK